MKKTIGLFSVLLHHPSEFVDRVYTIIDVRTESLYCRRPDYSGVDLREGLDLLANAMNFQGTVQDKESALASIEKRVMEQGSDSIEGPFASGHNGDVALARFCYMVARILQPTVTLETGVCCGVTTAYLLQALEVNSKGSLHSIDLPPLGKNADAYVGSVVPNELRSRWTLHRGTTRHLLSPLITSLRKIDLFIHDSLHTYRNMRMEFDIVWAALRPGGVLIADDIQGNRAFAELCERKDVAASFVVEESKKVSLFGFALKRA